MPYTYLTTLRDCLRYAVSRFNQAQLFFGHGSHNAFDEAAYLLLHSLHLPLEQLEPFLDARLLPAEIARCLEVIELRATQRKPAAYITHEAWLQGYRFYVDERTIVPRSFIAELIPTGFSPWVNAPENVSHILDLCTGSACLPILLADGFPQAQIDAVELSADALQVAHRNVNDYHMQQQIHLIESDLYAQLGSKQYDLIISNPPYVNSASMQTLPPEYRHEPALALAGGSDGMDIVRRILEGAAAHLKPHAMLIVEIGNERTHVENAWPKLPLTWLSTSAGDDMVFLITREDLIASFPEKHSLSKATL